MPSSVPCRCSGKSASVGPRRGKDHPCRDRSRVPAARLDDLRSKATAPVHGAQQVTDVHELGLELDDQESPALGMPEQRDRSHRARPRSRKTPLTPSPSQGSRGRERSRPTRAVPSGERSRADQVQPLCREEAARAGSRARRPLAEGQPASSPGSARARPSRRPSARRRPVSPGRPDARRVSGVRPGSCSRSGDRPRTECCRAALHCHLVAPGLLGIEAAPARSNPRLAVRRKATNRADRLPNSPRVTIWHKAHARSVRRPWKPRGQAPHRPWTRHHPHVDNQPLNVDEHGSCVETRNHHI